MLFIKKQDDSVSVRTHSCMTIIHNDSSISKSYRYTYISIYIYTVHSYPVFQLLTDLTGIVKKYIANTHINSFFFFTSIVATVIPLCRAWQFDVVLLQKNTQNV